MDDKDNVQCFAIGGDASTKRGFKERVQRDVIYSKTKEVKMEGKPWYSKRENATEPYEPYQLVGLYICKEHNGVRCLGTIIGYSPEKNNQLIDFEDLHIKMDAKDNDKGFVNRVEVGSSSAGAVNQITSRTSGKTKDANEVQPSDNPKKDMNVPEPKKVIGCDIYKEFEGIKAFGTVINYIPSANLFEVLYQNNNRMEYLPLDEIFRKMANKEDISRVQQLSSSPPSNSSNKAAETKMKKVAALGETSTSKMRSGNCSSGVSSNRIVNDIEETEVSPSDESKKKEKSKSACTSTKTEVKIEGKPWYSKKENATEDEPYEPYQFVGLYICKEHNGVRCLGTIQGYNPEMNNKLIVQYKGDGRIEYMTQIQALYAMAKREDFSPAQTRNASRKQSGKKNADIGEGSSRGKKK